MCTWTPVNKVVILHQKSLKPNNILVKILQIRRFCARIFLPFFFKVVQSFWLLFFFNRVFKFLKLYRLK